MGVSDFRVDCSFFDHPKTLKLARIAGEVAPLHFLRLIRFCAVTAGRSKGTFEGMDFDDIEIAAGWTGERHLFVTALIDVGFLDSDECLAIHEFEQHQPWVFHADGRSTKAKKAAKARWGTDQGRHINSFSCGNQKNEYGLAYAPEQKPHARTPKSDAQTPKSDAPIPIPIPIPIPNNNKIICSETVQKSQQADFKNFKREEKFSAKVQTIWQAYREHHPSSTGTLKSDRKEYRLIKKRLQEFTTKQIIDAIRGYESDPWFAVNCNRLEYYVRDAGKIEQGLEFYRKPRKNNDEKGQARGWVFDDENDGDAGTT